MIMNILGMGDEGDGAVTDEGNTVPKTHVTEQTGEAQRVISCITTPHGTSMEEDSAEEDVAETSKVMTAEAVTQTSAEQCERTNQNMAPREAYWYKEALREAAEVRSKVDVANASKKPGKGTTVKSQAKPCNEGGKAKMKRGKGKASNSGEVQVWECECCGKHGSRRSISGFWTRRPRSFSRRSWAGSARCKR